MPVLKLPDISNMRSPTAAAASAAAAIRASAAAMGAKAAHSAHQELSMQQQQLQQQSRLSSHQAAQLMIGPRVEIDRMFVFTPPADSLAWKQFAS